MGAGYTAIQWNSNKKKYDKVILIFSLGFLVIFVLLNVLIHPEITIETLIIRAFGSLAIFLLHVILLIGPLSRLDKRFIVLLYNRRHLGVTMFFIALIHGVYSTLNFHTLGNVGALVSLFTSNLHYNSFIQFPFEIFGITALGIFALMAFTSHDFWLKNLSPMIWKSLHMLVYPAYLFLLFHVLLGAIQNEGSLVLPFILFCGAITIIGIHIYTGFREFKKDEMLPEGKENWIKVGELEDIRDKRAKVVNSFEDRIAIFRNGRKVYAVSNYCKHQGGPIGEGKLVKGCITCPWHGYQYYAKNGCSPPPFEEKIHTYNLKLMDGLIYMHPKPNPEGTEVVPLEIKKK